MAQNVSAFVGPLTELEGQLIRSEFTTRLKATAALILLARPATYPVPQVASALAH